MRREPISYSELQRRRKLALAVIENGGSQAELARQLGVTPAGGLKWLRTHAPDLHERFKGDRLSSIDRHTALVRLLLLKSVEDFDGGMSRLARALKLTPAALSKFRALWAPDGLDAAIADLMPEDGEGYCQSRRPVTDGSAMELAHG